MASRRNFPRNHKQTRGENPKKKSKHHTPSRGISMHSACSVCTVELLLAHQLIKNSARRCHSNPPAHHRRRSRLVPKKPIDIQCRAGESVRLFRSTEKQHNCLFQPISLVTTADFVIPKAFNKMAVSRSASRDSSGVVAHT